MNDIIKKLNDFAEANRKYLESQGVELSEEDQKILDEYTKRFGGLPADGGFSAPETKHERAGSGGDPFGIRRRLCRMADPAVLTNPRTNM